MSKRRGKREATKQKRITTLSPSQVQDFKKAFEVYDTDGNGFIDIDELEQMVTNLQNKKPSRDELQQMMNEVDLNKDGRIDFSEFCYLMTR